MGKSMYNFGKLGKEKASQQKQYVELIHRKYSQLQIVEIRLFPHEIKGVERLRQVERSLFEG